MDAIFYDENKDALMNPSVIVEVLSPETEAHDRGGKFLLYSNLETLRDYVLIDQKRILVEVYTRQPEGRWLLTRYEMPDDELVLDSVQARVLVADLYDKVEFTSAP